MYQPALPDEPRGTATVAPGDDWIAERVRLLMPQLKTELLRLARIRSIAFPGFPTGPLREAYDAVAHLFQDAGVGRMKVLSLPDTPPILTGEIPAPDGAPMVLLYAHYDVQPAGDERLWESPPFDPIERDGAIYGRGAADDKSGIVTHVGALRAFHGRPPVGVKVVIEGQEEYGGAFDGYPRERPDLFHADAILICDAGNVRPGVPTLTTALRGDAEVILEVRTLAEARHSGEFGGAAPDALIALVRALATLHDEHGNVAVAGLRRSPWTGASFDEAEFRRRAAVEPKVPLLGTGTLGERLWSGPAITVVGIDAPRVDEAVNAVVPYARAKLNLRVHPEQHAAEAQAALIRHLEAVRPFGIALRATPAGEAGDGFAAATAGPAHRAARVALSSAWGRDPVHMATGGAIPLASALHEAVPEAEILLFGPQDGLCNLHAPNERVLLDELERAVIAEARFFSEYAVRKEHRR